MTEDHHATLRLSLRTWLSASYLIVLLLPVLAIWATGTLARDLRNQTRWDLEHQAAVLEVHVGRSMAAGDLRTLSLDLAQLRSETLAGFRVTDRDGIVVANSGSGIGSDLSADAEVQKALQGTPAFIVRPRPSSSSSAIGTESRGARVRVFVARPVWIEGEVAGVILLSRTPRQELEAMVEAAPRRALIGVILALLVTLSLAALSSFVLTRNLRSLVTGSATIAERPGRAEQVLSGPRGSHVAEVSDVADSLHDTALRLQRRLSYIAEFASNVSHEFKTPLATLRGTLELLEDDPEMEAAQRDRFLSNAAAEIARLESMVTGLLTLARAEEAHDHESVELRALVSEVIERHHGVTAEGEGRAVVGHRQQLAAVVENLVRNALVHGSEPVIVRLFTREGETGFVVEDAGPGVSPGNRERIFERFFTTRRGDGGVGLGLALVRTICRAHGGDVRLLETETGAAFQVSLPSG